MKSNTTLKNVLGLTQEEAAVLLGVTRGQWSMYDAGKRDLPLPATEKLASILLHLQNTKETSKEKQQFSAEEQRKVQEWLEKEQRNISYQKQLLERKKFTIENKRAECFAALEVVRFLETQPETIPPVLLEDIRTRATNTLSNYSLLQLEQLQMKEAHITLLQNRLEERMIKK